MVSTRSSSRKRPKPSSHDGGLQEKPKSPSVNDDAQEEEKEKQEPPTPVSSSSSEDDEKESSSSSSHSSSPANDTTTTSQKKCSSLSSCGGSRLYAPYRTMGIITSGQPYCLTHSGNSAGGASSNTSFCTLPIGNRFHVLQCDRLHPVLASGACHTGEISRISSDPSMGIAVVVHGTNYVTLYSRTRPVDTLKVNKKWRIVDMLDLGRIKVKLEEKGGDENTKVLALIMSSSSRQQENANKTKQNAADIVPVLGDSSDEDSTDHESGNEDSSSSSSSSDEDDSSSSSSSDQDEDDLQKSGGRVVLVLASRTSLNLLRAKRTSLPHDFGSPTVGLHPSTYVNKILVGSRLGNKLVLINVNSCKLLHQFTCLETTTKSSAISALEQSPDMDTIAVGTSCGMVHLVNIKLDAKLFSLSHNEAQITSLSFRTDGSAMRYGIAPMAVGRLDGTISIWDLTPKQEQDDSDEEHDDPTNNARTLLCEMQNVHSGGVSRLDFLPQEPLLISTGIKSNAVKMHVFDNPNHLPRLLRQRSGHTEPPSCIQYLHKSTSLLHQSLMDGTDASVCQVLSGGGKDGTLRSFSSARSVLDRELSQGRGLAKKAKRFGIDTAELLLPPIVDMAICNAKSRDWGDLVTIHEAHALAYVWNTRRGAQSGPVLRQPEWNVSAMQLPPPPSAHATAVCLSSCGNFCLVGTRGGKIFKYNVQSGIPRGSYPPQEKDPPEKRRQLQAGNIQRTMRALEKSAKVVPANKKEGENDETYRAQLQKQKRRLLLASHDMDVTGLAVDSLNKTVVSVGMDSKLTLWNFRAHAPHKKSPYMLPCPATKLCHVRDSDLAAIALKDYSVVLFDCVALAIVRRFGGTNLSSGEKNPVGSHHHTGPISGLDFAPDGRTLLTSSLDGTVRVWDVPTNTCVDWLAFESPPTSLTVSATGEMFATTHANQLGISLWSDKSCYQTIHVNGCHPPTKPAQMDHPMPLAEELEESNASAPASKQDELLITKELRHHDDSSGKESRSPPTPKQDGLVTLSGLPPSHWRNLFHLELVKERNKPKEPPKKPPSAPFFLQFRGGQDQGGVDANTNKISPKSADVGEDNDEEWEAAWSDDDDDADGNIVDKASEQASKEKKVGDSTEPDNDWLSGPSKKRMKVKHFRSHLASLLQECHNRQSPQDSSGRQFQAVTEHMATMGPSGIDVALSTLCHGMHDLEEGLPLLGLASKWLLEACQTRQNYEAVNAYLYRFLYLHSNTMAGIDDSIRNDEGTKQDVETSEEENIQRRQRLRLLETIAELRVAQRSASDALCAKMQHSLCLLRHFSRMV